MRLIGGSSRGGLLFVCLFALHSLLFTFLSRILILVCKYKEKVSYEYGKALSPSCIAVLESIRLHILKMHHKHLVPGTGNFLAINISVNIICN